MAHYSIGEADRLTGLSVSTLRYYDREGMFPNIERSHGGNRVFSDREIDTLKIIECLKISGMSINEIKEFLQWCQEGDASLQKRQEIFYKRLAEMEKQMEALQDTINKLKFKCWYYDTAVSAGTEEVVKNLPDEEIPKEFRKYKL